MGVAADHLGRDLRQDAGNVEFFSFLCNAGKEQDHEEKIAQFFPERRRRGFLDGIEDLVGLLQEVAAHILLRLADVPGAPALGSPKPFDDGQELFEPVCGFFMFFIRHNHSIFQ